MAEEIHPIGGMIKRISESMERKGNSDLQEYGVTYAQMKMLIVLENSPQHSLTLKELERIFGMTQATIAGTASRLEKKMLVEGYTEASDRRIKHIRLSEKGLCLCRSQKCALDQAEAKLLRVLDPQEAQTLCVLLQKLLDGLEAEDSWEENGKCPGGGASR